VDNLVKQRVVGAVVLVALAVIFIPILLEGPDEETGPRSLELPQPLEEMRAGRIEPLEPVLVVPPEPVTTVVIGEPADTATEAPEAVAEEVPVAPETPTAAESEPEPQSPPTAEASAPPAAPAPAPVVSGWVIQVGAFGQEANAIALRDRLRKAGHTAFVERINVAGNAVYRVRVGPYTERADAEAQLPALSRDAGLQGRVMSHP
jgi:DedD protein